MTLEMFLLWRYMQDRCAMLNSEEGKRELELQVEVGIADEWDEEERLHQAHPRTQHVIDASAYDAEAQEFMQIQAARAAHGISPSW